MIVFKSYKYRLLPNAAQEKQLRQFAGCRRFVWNWGLSRKQEHYRETGKSICYHALIKEVVAMKTQPDGAFLKECHSQILQQSLMDLDKAFASFFAKRSRFPRFKSSKRTLPTFCISQCVTVVGQSVKIPKIGLVKAIIHRPTEGVTKSATVKQQPNGAWIVSFISHVELPDSPATLNNPVGIDVGLESFATLCTGADAQSGFGNFRKVAPSKFYRKAELKTKRLQRRLSRSKAGSTRRAKAKRRLAKHHGEVRNRRNDWLHKLSARIVADHDAVCVEDLNIKGLERTNLGKSFKDAALGTFLRQLEYKAQWSGVQFVKVGRFFPSSKTCSGCGDRHVLTLSQRSWECQACGAKHDRDGNAALNILTEGLCLLAVK